MQAVIVKQFGSADHLAFVDLPEPTCGSDQVIIDVEAAGVGLVDIFQRQGILGAISLNYIPGLEVAGRIQSAGTSVDPMLVGKRVYARGSGGYSQRFLAKAKEVILLPDEVSAEAAVALGINALVARLSLIKAGLRAGESVLIRGASGGIGAMAAQMAVRMDAKVTAITNEAAADQIRSLGVHQVVRRGKDPAPQDTFDVIIDPVAGEAVPSFIDTLAPNGHYVVNGAAAGFPPAEIGHSLLKNFSRSPTYALFSLDSVPTLEAATVAGDIFTEAARGKLDTYIAQVLPLQEAAKAHKMLEAGSHFGKVILRP